MKRTILFTVINSLFFISATWSQTGYQIRVFPKNYEKNTMMLAYHYGNNQYIVSDPSTSTENQVFNYMPTRQKDGSFVFRDNDEPLKPGVYMLIFPPENDRYEILINENDQHFDVSFDYNDIAGTISFKGCSDDNRVLNNYRQFLTSKRNELQALKSMGVNDSKPLEDQLTAFQNTIIEKHPNYLSTALIKANLPLNIPEFKGTDEEVDFKKWMYTKQHFFDNINLSDSRLVRTPFLYDKVDYYMQRLTINNPDSIIKSIDFILERMEQSEENFKYFTVDFLNKYSKNENNLFGTNDAVYVHLVDKYYITGKSKWTDPENLGKIIQNANRLRPLLYGKTAPDISLVDLRGNAFDLHDFNSKYTLLFIWRSNCGHCDRYYEELKRNASVLTEYKIKILAITVDKENEVLKYWNNLNQKEINDLLIYVKGTKNEMEITEKYAVQGSPQLFLLNSQKEILLKKVNVQDLVFNLKNIDNNIK